MNGPALRVQREGPQLTLTLARPERGNALSPDLVEPLLAAVLQANADDSLHSVVLCADGRHFCTGLDLSDLAERDDAHWLWRLVRIEQLLQALWQSPHRTVALVQGRAWGAGADLVAACEQRVGAADASFRFPGAQFGIVLGTRRLALRLGTDAARSLVLQGAQLDAAAALAAGLLTARGTEPPPFDPRVDTATARALRVASRLDPPGAAETDLAALVRSAAQPGLRDRIQAYRDRVIAAR